MYLCMGEFFNVQNTKVLDKFYVENLESVSKDGIVEMSEIFMNDEIISLPTNSRKIQKNSLRPERNKKQCKIQPESKSKNINANI